MVEKESVSSKLGLPEVFSEKNPDPKIIRTLIKGFTRLINERHEEEKPLFKKSYGSIKEIEKIDEKFKQRTIKLFRQARVEYWPFHQAVLEHEKIEKEKTQSTKIWSKSGSILNWLGGIEEIVGSSGN